METSLRPLTLGEILDRTAQLYRSHFWLFAGIASINSGAILLLNLVEIGAQELLRFEHLLKYALLLSAAGAMGQILLSFVIGGIAIAANNRAVAWLHLGEPATIRGAYAGILPRAGRYTWLMVMIAFKVWMPMFLAYVGLIAGLFIFRPASKAAAQHAAGPAAAYDPGTSLLLAGVLVLGSILFLACIVYAVLMILRYSLAIAASVVEDLKARQAIRRSIELSKGSRGRIFLLLLLVGVIYLGLLGVTQAAFFVMAIRHGQLSAGAQVLQQLVAFVTDTFLGPIYATGLTLFYYDQRVRKEGYDIEWMMQAAGLVEDAGLTPTADQTPAADSPVLEASAPNHEPEQPEHA